MHVSVKYLAQLKSLAGKESTVIELQEGTTVKRLLEALSEDTPALADLADHGLLIMVNDQSAIAGRVLHDGDQIMLLQILGGG